jgi:hypothetical protein
VCIVARASAAVDHGPDIFGWGPTQFSERIETAEDQAAIIAKNFTQTCYAGQYDGIVVIALNPGTITSWAMHGIFSLRAIRNRLEDYSLILLLSDTTWRIKTLLCQSDLSYQVFEARGQNESLLISSSIQ